MFNIRDIVNYKTLINPHGNWGVIVEILNVEDSVHQETKGIRLYRINPLDTKILVSNDDVRWYRAHFAMFENGTIYSFSNGTTSFTYEYSAFEPWKHAILYEEGNNFVSLRELL